MEDEEAGSSSNGPICNTGKKCTPADKKKIKKKIKDACKIEDKENQKFKKKQDNRNKTGKNKKHKSDVRDMTWKDKYCKKVLVDFEKTPKDLKKDVDDTIADMLDMEEHLKDIIKDIADVDVGDAIAIACSGARKVPIPWIKLAGYLCTGVSVLLKGSEVYESIKDVKDTLKDIEENLEELKKQKKDIEELLAIQKKCDTGAYTTKQCTAEKRKKKKEIYDKMKKAVEADPCLKARRCQHIAFKENTLPAGIRKKLKEERGCCPGQRAHHIIPDAKVKNCTGYKHADAPTICLEGGKDNGSHGDFHDATDDAVDDIITGENPNCDMQKDKVNSLKSTIEASVAAYKERHKHCNEDCLRKELQAHYKKIENCTKINANTKSESGKEDRTGEL